MVLKKALSFVTNILRLYFILVLIFYCSVYPLGTSKPSSIMPRFSSMAVGLLATFIVAIRAASISDVIVCYNFNGDAFSNYTRCPGSDACCALEDTCVSNRLCKRKNDPNFVRGPCAVKPWRKGQCPQICDFGT